MTTQEIIKKYESIIKIYTEIFQREEMSYEEACHEALEEICLAMKKGNPDVKYNEDEIEAEIKKIL